MTLESRIEGWLLASDEELTDKLGLGKGGAHKVTPAEIRELLMRFKEGESAQRIGIDLGHARKWGRDQLIKLDCYEARPATKERGNLLLPPPKPKKEKPTPKVVHKIKAADLVEMPLFGFSHKKRKRESSRRKYLEKYKTDRSFRIKEIHRRRFAKLMNRQYPGKRMERLVGMPWHEVCNWLEQNFQEGMTWENRGEWHVDHVVPLSWFDLEIESEALVAWNWRNIRPLWGAENIARNDSGDGAVRWFMQFEPCEIVRAALDRAIIGERRYA